MHAILSTKPYQVRQLSNAIDVLNHGYKYPIHIAWSEEDDAYLAACPAFPGLSAFGDTEEKAVTEAKVALKSMIDVCRKREFRSLSLARLEHTTAKRDWRLSKSLHRQAAAMAEAEQVSLNQYIVDAVIARVTGEQVASRALAEVKRHLKGTQLTAQPNTPRGASAPGERALSNDLSTRNPRS